MFKLKSLQVCENFIHDNSGKYSLINIFTTITSSEVPINYKPFFVVTHITSSKEGKFIEEIEIQNTKNNRVIGTAKSEISIENDDGNILITYFDNIKFEDFTKYKINIKVGGYQMEEENYLTLVEKS
ncbi:MAG: hypothetical protein H6791_01350 [Candidatus Nomurabacteria bacterium]|nr:MAG: hypothetical protein H6791_01350 [Candidatus Nomurabacteria bacterium]